MAVRRIMPYYQSPDLEATRGFYTRVLGLEEGTFGGGWVGFGSGQAQVLFAPPGVERVMPDMGVDVGSAEAVDADEALAILQSRSDIALLFTDVQMPGSMNGLQLAHVVHARWPPIKIILASGQLKLSTSDIPQDSRFFGKPLKSDEMIAEMREMLGRA